MYSSALAEDRVIGAPARSPRLPRTHPSLDPFSALGEHPGSHPANVQVRDMRTILRDVDPTDILPAATNPFVFARALAPDEAMDRPEAAVLVERAAGGHNAVLYAPRRFGKTTLLNQVLERAAELEMPGVRIDLTDVLSPADVAARLEQAFRALPGGVRRLVSKELSGVSITTPVGGISLSRRSPVTDPLAGIHMLLELPAQIAERQGQRVVVVLDEVQALMKLDGLDGVFRSHIQHHRNVSYLFSGSEPSLLRALFEDRARPLYGQAEQIRLGRLDFSDAHDFVARKFSQTGKDVGDAAVEAVFVTEGHPQRLMLVANQLWERTRPDTPAPVTDVPAAYDAALRMSEPELRYLWESLTTNEQRVVAALAAGYSPYQQEAKVLMGIANRSSAARSVESLEGKAVIERDGDDLKIVDPFLGRWVSRRGATRQQIFVIPHQGAWLITDGPSLAFMRSTHQTLEAAEAEAQTIAAGGRGADLMILDTDDPNDLPAWAVGVR